MNWFRLYHDVLNDPKVQTLPAETFRAWINVLCIANMQTDRGSLPPLGNVSWSLRTTPDEAERLVNDLADRGLIDVDDEGNRRIHGWDSRQFKSDDVTSRTRKFRSENTPPGAPKTQNVPTPFPGTPPEQSRAEQKQNRTEPPSGGGTREAHAAAAGGHGSHSECIRIAHELFGVNEAGRVAAKGKDIDRALNGRWDSYAAALREIDRRRRRPGAKPITNLHALALKIAPDLAGTNGHPAPEPTLITPAAPTPEEKARQNAELMAKVHERRRSR